MSVLHDTKIYLFHDVILHVLRDENEKKIDVRYNMKQLTLLDIFERKHLSNSCYSLISEKFIS